MSAFSVKAGDVWKTASKSFVKVDGTWRGITRYYIKVNGEWKSISELFPPEPSSYDLVHTCNVNGSATTSETWTAPAKGWYQIEVFGASGNGGKGKSYIRYVSGETDDFSASGGGGGGGGYACSKVKMNAGDTIVLAAGIVGETTSAIINSTVETYKGIAVTSGSNGGDASGLYHNYIVGAGGAGGEATGGTDCFNGYDGKNGTKSGSSGGAGGAPGYSGGNTGGTGGYGQTQYVGKEEEHKGESGSAGFIKIYQGYGEADEPVVSTFYLQDLNGAIHEYKFENGMDFNTFVNSSYNDGQISIGTATVMWDLSDATVDNAVMFNGAAICTEVFDSANFNIDIMVINADGMDTDNRMIIANKTYYCADNGEIQPYVIFDNGTFAEGCGSIKQENGYHKYPDSGTEYLEAKCYLDAEYDPWDTAIALCAGYDVPDGFVATGPSVETFAMRGFNLSSYDYLHITVEAATGVAGGLDNIVIGFLEKDDGYEATENGRWPGGVMCKETSIKPQNGVKETFTISVPDLSKKAVIYVSGAEGNNAIDDAYLRIYKVWVDNEETAENAPSIPVTYTMTHNYTNVTSNHVINSIQKNSAYSAQLTPADGYELKDISITMGGVDITESCYDSGVIKIDAVTGDIVITASATEIQTSTPTTYTITHNYTNVTSNNQINSITEGEVYEATLAPLDGYEINSIIITETDTGNDITLSENCVVSLETGALQVVVNTNITISAVAQVQQTELDKIYIFDSSRSDNFLFGNYKYMMSDGTETMEFQVTWPYAYDEHDNSTASRIVLAAASSGMFTPLPGYEGYCNSTLKISANSSDGTQYINNVVYAGKDAGKAGIPKDQALKICINAYVEKNAGSPTFAYCSSSGAVEVSTTITSTSLTKYSINISALSTGYIQLSAGTGCGSLIVTDIWAE